MTRGEILDFIKAHRRQLKEQLGVEKIGLFGSDGLWGMRMRIAILI